MNYKLVSIPITTTQTLDNIWQIIDPVLMFWGSQPIQSGYDIEDLCVSCVCEDSKRTIWTEFTGKTIMINLKEIQRLYPETPDDQELFIQEMLMHEFGRFFLTQQPETPQINRLSQDKSVRRMFADLVIEAYLFKHQSHKKCFYPTCPSIPLSFFSKTILEHCLIKDRAERGTIPKDHFPLALAPTGKKNALKSEGSLDFDQFAKNALEIAWIIDDIIRNIQDSRSIPDGYQNFLGVIKEYSNEEGLTSLGKKLIDTQVSSKPYIPMNIQGKSNYHY